MPPSPTHKTNYAAEALSLLTSRYQKPRPGGLVTGGLAVAMAPWNLSASCSSFNPTDLSNLLAWYRADMGISIGTGVSGWADQSGTGDANKNLAQATGTKQPTFTATDAAYGNRPTLTFSAAASQFLASGTFAASISQPYTIFVVGNDDGSAVNAETYWGRNGAVNGAAIDSNAVPGAYDLYAGTIMSSGMTPTTAPKIIVGVFNGGSSAIYISAVTVKAVGNAGAQTVPSLALGADVAPTAASFFNGKLAEAGIYGGALSPSQVAQIQLYAGVRYSFTIGP